MVENYGNPQQPTATIDDFFAHQQKQSAPPPPAPEKGADAPPTEQQETNWDAYFNGEAPAAADAKTDSPTPGSSEYAQMYGEPSTASRIQAKIAARMTDMGASHGLKAVAQSPTRKPYKADPEDYEDMQEIWAIYIESRGQQIPPGALLMLTILVIYGTKVPDALADRKYNRQKKAADNEKREAKKAAQQATGPSKGSKTEIIEEHEIEELDDTDLAAEEKLGAINRAAEAYGLEPLARIDLPDPGVCHYNWFFKGVPERAMYGKFANAQASSKWGHIHKAYQKAGIDISFLTDLK